MFRVSVNASRRGGVKLRMVFAALTLVLVAYAVVRVVDNQREIIKVNHRKAAEYSDAGMQRALETSGPVALVDPSAVKGIALTPAGEGSFEVVVHVSQSDTVALIEFESTGRCGGESVAQTRRVNLVHNPDTLSSVQWIPADD